MALLFVGVSIEYRIINFLALILLIALVPLCLIEHREEHLVAQEQNELVHLVHLFEVLLQELVVSLNFNTFEYVPREAARSGENDRIHVLILKNRENSEHDIALLFRPPRVRLPRIGRTEYLPARTAVEQGAEGTDFGFERLVK